MVPFMLLVHASRTQGTVKVSSRCSREIFGVTHEQMNSLCLSLFPHAELESGAEGERSNQYQEDQEKTIRSRHFQTPSSS